MDCICRKHPNRDPSPGVCSLCLKECLSSLSTYCKPSASTSAASLSSCSSYSSSFSDVSSTFSILPSFPAEDEEASISYLISKEGQLVKKPAGRIWPLRRSQPAVVQAGKRKDKKAENSGGFGLWSLLLRKGKKEAVGGEEKIRKRRFYHSVRLVKEGVFLGGR